MIALNVLLMEPEDSSGLKAIKGLRKSQRSEDTALDVEGNNAETPEEETPPTL